MKLVNKNTVCLLLNRMERLINLSIPPVTILAYHAISHDKTIVDIDPYTFQKQIAIVQETCEFVTLDQVVSFIQGKELFLKPVVALTFDDGYADVFRTVMPLLGQMNIRATVFALSNPDNVNRKELENKKDLLTNRQLQLLHAYGWTIGCHSATHANFADVGLNVQQEIIEAKKQLESTLGFKISHFAYPKGFYSPFITQAVKYAGYVAGFAFEAGVISSKTNLYTIPRIPVDWTHTEEQFNAFFTNWGVKYLQTKQKYSRNILNI